MGADRAILVTADSADPWAVARLLVKIVEKESPELVLMGKQAIDDDSNVVGQILAELLGWPQATFISVLELQDGNAAMQCVREIDGGLQTVKMSLPAVITADLPVLLFTLMLPYTVYFVERYRERRALFPAESGAVATFQAARTIWV